MKLCVCKVFFCVCVCVCKSDKNVKKMFIAIRFFCCWWRVAELSVAFLRFALFYAIQLILVELTNPSAIPLIVM